MAGGGTPAHGWLQACEDPGHGLPQVPGCQSGASCVIRVSAWPGVLRPLRPGLLGSPPTRGFTTPLGRQAAGPGPGPALNELSAQERRRPRDGPTEHVTDTARGAHGRPGGTAATDVR